MISYRFNLGLRHLYLKTPNVVFSDNLDRENMDKMTELRNLYEDGKITEQEFEQGATLILFPQFEKMVVNTNIMRKLDQHPDFHREGNYLYLNGINLSIPEQIAKQMSNVIDNEDTLISLMNFWRWLVLNPSPESRSHLYDTVVENGIQILKCGLLLMYRRVVKMNNVDTGLLEWASKTYAKLRRRKKSTNVKVFRAYDDSLNHVYNLEDGEYVGMLPELRYSNEEQYYTDNYTKTCKFYIGKEARMPRAKVNANRNESCSTGFHLGARGFAYSSFGDTPIACIVNPMDIVAVMKNEQGKTRTAAFTPIAVLNEDAEWKDEADIDSLVDIAYDQQIARLQELMATAQIEDEDNVIETEFNMQLKSINTIQLFCK